MGSSKIHQICAAPMRMGRSICRIWAAPIPIDFLRNMRRGNARERDEFFGRCRRRRRSSAHRSKVYTYGGPMLSGRVRHPKGAERSYPEEMYYSKIAIRVTVMNKV